MAANKGIIELEKLFDEIIIEIAENGSSMVAAVNKRMSTLTFYDLLKDDDRLKKYARACEMRADKMAEEMIEIADSNEEDTITDEKGIERANNAAVQRDRLKVDTRKWLLAKMHPKKYGDKIDMTSGNEPLGASQIIFQDISGKIINSE
jgi:hypothetical protein